MNPDCELTERLSEDEHFELLRGRRAGSHAPVLLKRPRQQQPRQAACVATLRRECAIAAKLSSGATLLPRIVESASSAMLLMEDPGGSLLSMQLATLLPGQRLPLDTVLAIGVQLAALLAELHRSGLVHHGVRPEVILCNPSQGRAWLVDFRDASAAASSRPAQANAAANSSARLVYIAPEQTGRIERMPDPRSDLYALGIVLYELLTGAPPFRSADALEQIHWHIAGTAREPASVIPSVPATLSNLVMKLLAKAPEERYQSATGLAQDLAVCARDWSVRRAITPFPLGRRDIGEQLLVSAKLYGREREVHTLLAAFEQVCGGRTGTMLLVEGYAGVGKTALIEQLVRPIVRRKGYFISGKFDQVVRGVPFGALIQAFRGLVRQLLSESETQLAAWRAALTAALGSQGGVLAEVMPEIEFIVGPQAAPALLGSLEAQNRFQRVLQNFCAALARPEHPLVLFLDDLQWADAATLALLEPLLTSGDIRCLMVIGAYRDHELDASPRLARTLSALAASGAALTRVILAPLEFPDLTQMVADTLRCGTPQAAPLAELVHRKTGGNPLFVGQFLKLLEREGHLRFDEERACWAYRIDQLADAPLADNVVELMTRSIQRLPPKSQYALTLAACIGNRFDALTLAIVSEQSAAAATADLEPAIAEGLVQPSERGLIDDEPARFAFLHDRVQQSAYALIPAERRQMLHLTVGRLLRSRATAEQRDAALFDIVHHFNLGAELIHNPAEKREVAALNLEAALRAKASTAHDTALELLLAGQRLLDAAAWQADPALCFELHLELAESHYLCGHFDAAQQAFAELLAKARTRIERARVIRLRGVQHENMAHYAEALANAREGLALFDLALPDVEGDQAAALEREIAAIGTLRAGRSIAELVELPVMTNPDTRMVMSMLTDVWASAYILGQSTVARLISATLVRLSLEHGNVEESAYGYVTHAITVGPVRGEYQAAYEFGWLALGVNERFGDTRRRAKIYQQFHAHVNLWCRPLHTCMAYAREACRSGLESGDYLYAAYGAGTELWSAIVAHQDLARFVADYTPHVALIEKLKNRGFADSVRLILNWAKALQGVTQAPLSLSDASLDEDAYLRTYGNNPFFATIHAVARLQVCALLGTPAQALQAAQHSAGLVHHVPGTVWPVIHAFWHGVALAANIAAANADANGDAIADPIADPASNQREAWLVQLQQSQAMFEALAVHCAENFLCQARLLSAELARIDGRPGDAIALCEQAIEFAADKPLLQFEALAYELCGRLRLQQRQTGLAAMHLREASARYRQWGALAKVQALAYEHPALTQPHDANRRAGDAPQPELPHPALPLDAMPAELAHGLDMFSVLKAAQAIAGEVEFGGLLARLMRIAIENAGAERGALVLEGVAGDPGDAGVSGALVYTAEANTPSRPETEHGVPLERAGNVPEGVVNFVRRTAEPVVLAQATTDEQHSTDPYVQQHQPRSVLCVPVQRQGQLIGVLYLENRRAAGVFTPQRLNTVRILAAQAAISLENARLFASLKREIAERGQAQDNLSGALAEVERLKEGLEAENTYLRRDLIANVSHDLRTPLVSMRGYLEVLASKGERLSAEQRQQYLGIAVRQSEHLATLIDELFELAKLDFKGVALNREPIPLGELAADVVQKFQLAADDKAVALAVDAQPHLPFVQADVSLMERVLDNLIGNALKHTPTGGRVCVSLRVEGDCVLAQVADTGSGIASAELPFIFDRFYRGENGRTAQSGGAGLGLAITKRILELHHTDIRVQSDPATGTCFTFSLPASF